MGETEARFWRKTALRLRRRLNAGVWLARVVPLWTAGALAFSAILLWERGRGGTRVGILVALFSIFLIASGLFSLLRARLAYFDLEDALVLLDERLRLHNRLTCARAGIGAWPPILARPISVLGWRSERSWLPLVFSAAFVGAAGSLPIEVELPPSAAAPAPPSSWKEMEAALAVLREEAPVRKEALERYEARLEELRSRPEKEWFEHGSLEASDSLREELAADMRELLEAISDLESSLQDLERLEAYASQPSRRLEERRLRESLENLEQLSLPVDPGSTRELQTLARGGKVRAATKEEIEKWKRIRERLYHGLPGGEEEIVVALSRSRGSGSDGAGKGGVSRGPGAAPLELSGEPSDLGSERIELAPGRDASEDSPQAVVGFSMGAHEVDTEGFRTVESGASLAGAGEGGELVFRQSLAPNERRILMKYFK